MMINKAYLKAASTQEHLENIDRLCKQAPPGDFMECGVLRGGTAAVLINAANCHRDVYLCDTFSGYPRPTEKDTNIDPSPYRPGFGKHTIEEVRARLLGYGLGLEKTSFIQGDFKDTLPALMKRIKKLALVNFDGDWYESVMSAFPHIIKKLVPGGVLIIHDYPKYNGLVEAVHKFIKPENLRKFSSDPAYSGVYYLKGGN